jgi:hypothetical protein
MPNPIALSDEQLDIIRHAAEPLQPHDRGPYLRTVAELLNDHEIGDGVVARAAREAKARFLRAPEFAVEPRQTKYR